MRKLSRVARIFAINLGNCAPSSPRKDNWDCRDLSFDLEAHW